MPRGTLGVLRGGYTIAVKGKTCGKTKVRSKQAACFNKGN